MKRLYVRSLAAMSLGLGSIAVSQVITSSRPTSAAQLASIDAHASLTLRALASGQVVAGPCLVDEPSPAGTTFTLIRSDGVNESRVVTICNLSAASIELRLPGLSSPLAVIEAGRSEAVDYLGDGLTWRTQSNEPALFAWVAR